MVVTSSAQNTDTSVQAFYRWQPYRDQLELLIRVRVQPGASREVCDGQRAGQLRLRIAAPPVSGAANRNLCKHLASRLGVKSGRVEVIKGLRHRNKVVAVLIDPKCKVQIEARLRDLAEPKRRL